MNPKCAGTEEWSHENLHESRTSVRLNKSFTKEFNKSLRTTIFAAIIFP